MSPNKIPSSMDVIKDSTTTIAAFFYIYISIMGLLYYFAYYYVFGVNILVYYTTSDYFLSGLKQPFLILLSLIIIIGYLYSQFRGLILRSFYGLGEITFEFNKPIESETEVLEMKSRKVDKKDEIPPLIIKHSLLIKAQLLKLTRGYGLKLAILFSILILPLSGIAVGYFTKYLSKDRVFVQTIKEKIHDDPVVLLGSTQNFFLFYSEGPGRVQVYRISEVKAIDYIAAKFSK